MITLCQRSYARKILEAAGMSECNACHTPMENRLKLHKEDGGGAMVVTLYRSIIGSLRYLVNSRPNIAHAMRIAGRYMEKLSTHHWVAVKQIQRYVKGLIGHGCCYKAGNGVAELVRYDDSYHAGDLEDRKSTSGIMFFLDNNIITWCSLKQRVVAQSLCEAGCYTHFSAVLFFRCIMREYGF